MRSSLNLPGARVVAASAIALSLCGLWVIVHSAPALLSFITRQNQNNHVVELTTSDLDVLWEKRGLMTSPNGDGVRMAAIDGRVFVLGLQLPSPLEGVLAFDGSTGEREWSADRLNASYIAASRDSLLVGTYTGVVISRDPATGQSRWSRRLSWTGGVKSLHVIGDQVYVYTGPPAFHLLDLSSGDVLQESETQDITGILLIEDGIRYVKRGFSAALRAENARTGELIWETTIEDTLYEAPLFTPDKIIVRAGELLGLVYVIDRGTGTSELMTQGPVVSNLVMANNGPIFLLRIGELVQLDLETGNQTVLARIAPGDFPVHGDVGGYYLAADNNTSVLYILLGDTGQLIALTLDA